ncbi:hypothetical protein, partial [Streptomyces gossypiisoli]|uniref:hypothetical protein n=1 Tax=Streptomyces gossypiisoli TaxID=2748864 RepID=UPI001E5BEC6F
GAALVDDGVPSGSVPPAGAVVGAVSSADAEGVADVTGAVAAVCPSLSPLHPVRATRLKATAVRQRTAARRPAWTHSASQYATRSDCTRPSLS